MIGHLALLLLIGPQPADIVLYKPTRIHAAPLVRQIKYRFPDRADFVKEFGDVTFSVGSGGVQIQGEAKALANAKRALAVYDQPLRRVTVSVATETGDRSYSVGYGTDYESSAPVAFDNGVTQVSVRIACRVNDDETVTVLGTAQVKGKPFKFAVRIRSDEHLWLRQSLVGISERHYHRPTRWYGAEPQPGVKQEGYKLLEIAPSESLVHIRATLLPLR